jgi:ATP-dependent DNA helicase PIF1
VTQEDALNILKMGHNVFLTGQAGSGKTYLLNRYIEYLKQRNVPVAITASTGIAATHMDGMTIHSWSGIGINNSMTAKEIDALTRKSRVHERFQKTKVLIIDEISMLHSYRLSLVELVARIMKGTFEPFGGMQVILSGDFFQLPPVSKDTDSSVYFAFKSAAWKAMNIKICYLETQHRQTDKIYSSVLNAIRGNSVNQETLDVLNARYRAHILGREITRLYTHNVDVDAINNIELSKLSGEPKRFFMRSRGIAKLVVELKRNCLASENLVLKKGAAVMFVKNNFEKEYVNGTLGTVVNFDESGDPIVRTKNGKTITALPEKWKLEEGDTVIAEISQVPLRLAWAITVHKSQGMSLDAAEVDLSKSFEPGMGYVALSRIRSLGGLRLMGFNETALKVHPEVLATDQQFADLSRGEAEAIKTLSSSELDSTHKAFIKKMNPAEPAKAYSVEEIRETHRKAYEKWTEKDDLSLKAEFKAGKSVKELSEFLERKVGAIRSRLKKLNLQ